VVVHTDDVAWHHSFFDWTVLLRDNVLAPLHQGLAVEYRPPAWEERRRDGAIVVPASCPLVLVEGVGAARTELTMWIDVAVWVQSDMAAAKQRGVLRDGADQAAVSFWEEWEAEEIPLLTHQRPWERAAVVVAGTQVLEHDPATEVVLADNEGQFTDNQITREGPGKVDLSLLRPTV
jgi:hypothetical protein